MQNPQKHTFRVALQMQWYLEHMVDDVKRLGLVIWEVLENLIRDGTPLLTLQNKIREVIDEEIRLVGAISFKKAIHRQYCGNYNNRQYWCYVEWEIRVPDEDKYKGVSTLFSNIVYVMGMYLHNEKIKDNFVQCTDYGVRMIKQLTKKE